LIILSKFRIYAICFFTGVFVYNQGCGFGFDQETRIRGLVPLTRRDILNSIFCFHIFGVRRSIDVLNSEKIQAFKIIWNIHFIGFKKSSFLV